MYRFFVLLSMALNVLTGGSWGEPLSCRLGYRQRMGCGLCRWFCRFLDLFDSGHCEKSYRRHRRGVDKDKK